MAMTQYKIISIILGFVFLLTILVVTLTKLLI